MSCSVSDSPGFDVVIAADFASGGDPAYRLAEEVRFLAGQGQSVGLLQYRAPHAGCAISAEIMTCLRRGLAKIVPHDTPSKAALLILHAPSLADMSLLKASLLHVGDVAVVCHRALDLKVSVPDFSQSGIHLFVTHPALRALGGAEVEALDWLPPPPAGQTGKLPAGRTPAIGWISTSGLDGREAMECWQMATTAHPACEHYALGPDVRIPVPRLPDLSLDRLTDGLETFVFAPSPDCQDLPDTIVAAAISAGRDVILPQDLRQHYGRGPTYFDHGKLGETLIKRMGMRRKAKVAAGFVGRAQAAPLRGLVSAPASPAPPPETAERPILCLAANGVGVGHLTRLLAIARKLSGPIIFVTHAPAVGIVQDFGYPVRYIPSSAAVGGDPQAWDSWFRVHLDLILDEVDPAMVVYDGNHPSWGLVGAVASRRDCRLAWVRRGMWGGTTSEFLTNARWCDLVIEPGDLAEAGDTGITSERRHEVVRATPIRLLETSDLLPRSEAAALLGLNPARPAALIQLGSGYNRDLLSLLDQVISAARSVPGLQIAVAEWVVGTLPLTLWPDVTVLRGFPISQYIRAFDFCISAAGYNSFHEVIHFGVPTVFIANTHPSMDDQYGRAKFAQNAAAAFEISAEDLAELPDLINLLMQDAARRFLIRNCEKLHLPNGALAAAQMIETISNSGGRVSV